MKLRALPALLGLGALACAGGLGVSGCASARHAEPSGVPAHEKAEGPAAADADKEAPAAEEVVVTGSRIPRPEAASAAPVTVAGRSQQEAAQATPQAAPAAPAGGATGFTAQALPAPPPPPVHHSPAPAKRAEELAFREPPPQGNTFARLEPHAFTATAEDRLSTFAVDVDTASYTLSRRYLQQGALPPPAAVRVEEFVNAFRYAYPAPAAGAFSVHLEGAPSPFGRGRTLLKVGLQGRTVSKAERKPAHLVFLVDVSGSMASADRLPLAQEALKLLVKNLNENDTVALVTYAGAVRDVLPPTPATDLPRISAAIDSLTSGGGTSMGSGLELAYAHALRKAGGGNVSRVIVLSDGDANLGRNQTPDAMLQSVQKAVAEGVTLSAVGFGIGNYRDDLMERLANRGNGNCYYIDGMREARKVFQTQLAGTLEVIAKDVKVQVEFDPAAVSRYRLLGYENRDVADGDFRNDRVDAGEIGAGHSVTALYEVELTGAARGDLATVRVRAKDPHGSQAREQVFRFGRERVAPSLEKASDDLRFAVAVAGSADVLRRGPTAEGWNLAAAQALAEGAAAGLPERGEFVRLLARARELEPRAREVARGQP
jgi:Ca-activated chloride channel family protein